MGIRRFYLSRFYLFLVVFLMLAARMYGQAGSYSYQNDESRIIQRLTWKADIYALRYEVIIQEDDKGVYTEILRHMTENFFIDVSLPPGNYRLAVIPYDFRNLPAGGLNWKNFTIVSAQVPELTDLSTDLSADLSTDFSIPDDPEEGFPASTVVSAEEPEIASTKYKDFFVGVFGDAIGYSPGTIAYGGGLSLGGSINNFAFGINLLYALDPEDFIFMEAVAFIRRYLFRFRPNTGIFVELQGGAVFFGQEKLEISNHNAVSAGLGAGCRFPLGKHWYIEPNIRGGYPYILGGSVSVGMRFGSD